MSTTETTARTRGVLVATCLSTLVVNANTSAVSILLPAISEDTGMSVATLQWAVTGYSLVGAAVIITSGSLGDVFGRKRIFQLGLLLFVASCVLIALSNTGEVVIAGRMIQGAAGSTILACGLSLLSVANSGQAQLRAVSLWGAAAAVGAAAGPLLGGVLVEVTGWQGLFWVDAVVAVVCIVLTAATVTESRDPDRPRSIDFAGTILVALTLAPLILALSKGSDWGWFSTATVLSLLVAVAAAVAFVVVEKRMPVPLLDLALLRNRVLVGSTVAILIGAGTINALMYVLSLWFQDPSSLGFTPLQAGLATLPATVGLVVVAPLVPRFAARLGARQVVGLGFAITAAGFAVIGLADADWLYGAFVIPLIAIAVGMGLSNGPASSASTACVPVEQVGSASGVSNMARYVGAAVATALAATIYSSVTASGEAKGQPTGEALTNGLQATSWMMALFSLAGVAMAVIMGRQARSATGTLEDAAAAATAAESEFCTASTSYVTAIDRYGDVLNATATTVGDVKDAGSDLAQPGEDAQKSTQAVAETRSAVATAEQELADAQAALVAAQASAAGTTPPAAPPSQTPSPSPTPASVTRVQEAQTELAAAQAGITDKTPLAQAAEQFNAAAVALEMAWLQLIGDSGCLTDAQQGTAAKSVSSYTKALQQALADAGYYDATVDGIYGPKTVAAVQALQEANGLPQTGTPDKATEKALRSELAAKGGAAAQEETASTAAVQQTLKLAGYWDGSVDGVWTDALTDALEALQKDLGVKVTGTVDAATIAALEKAIADAGQSASPNPSPSPSRTAG